MRHGIDTHVWHFSLYRTLSHLMTFEVKKKKKKKRERERERERGGRGGGGGGGGEREEGQTKRRGGYKTSIKVSSGVTYDSN